MSGSSTSGIRGDGANTFYFPPYNGKQYDSLPKTGAVIYPNIVANRTTYYNRTKYGTKYDVRSSYADSHVLRQTPSNPLLPKPISTSSSSGLSDLFIKAIISQEDEGLQSMQEKERERRKDAKIETERWLLRAQVSTSGHEDRWMGSKLFVKSRNWSVVEKNSKEKGWEESRPRVRDECGTRRKEKEEKNKSITRRTIKSPTEWFYDLFNWYSLLIACCMLLCLIPAAAAANVSPYGGMPIDPLDDFFFEDAYLELGTDPFPSFVLTFADTIVIYLLLFLFVLAFLCSAVLASFDPLKQFCLRAILCSCLFCYCGDQSLVLVSLILLNILRSPDIRTGVTIIKETCADATDAIGSCNIWADLWDVLEDFFVSFAIVSSRIARWCFLRSKMYGGLLLIAAGDIVRVIILIVMRKVESKRFWLYIAAVVMMANWLMLDVIEVIWKHNVLITRWSPERCGKVRIL